MRERACAAAVGRSVHVSICSERGVGMSLCREVNQNVVSDDRATTERRRRQGQRVQALVRAPSTSGGTAPGGDRSTPCRAPMTNPLSALRAPRERASARRESDRLERAAVRERAGSAVEPVSGASERRAHARNVGRSCHGQKVACWRVDVALRVDVGALLLVQIAQITTNQMTNNHHESNESHESHRDSLGDFG